MLESAVRSFAHDRRSTSKPLEHDSLHGTAGAMIGIEENVELPLLDAVDIDDLAQQRPMRFDRAAAWAELSRILMLHPHRRRVAIALDHPLAGITRNDAPFGRH